MGSWKRRIFLPCSEAITYGQLVNTFDDGGVFSVRLADATDDTKPCHGVCNTVGTSTIGDTLEIVMPNAYVKSIGGLSPGTIYYLSTTPGIGTNVAPSGSGNIVQAIGLALETDGMLFNPAFAWGVVP
jgi:hypothetical protein